MMIRVSIYKSCPALSILSIDTLFVNAALFREPGLPFLVCSLLIGRGV